jgi:SAM-dependent methyltransferase
MVLPAVKERTNYMSMRLVTFEEYLEYVKMHEKVTIEDETIIVGKPHKIEKYQPDNFILERSSVWSFPHRGDWATHKGDYRGNWAPQIPRNLLLRYSRPGEVVLDQMCGGGTTLVECKLLGRNAIGVDINYEAVILTLDRLNFSYTPLDEDYKEPNIKVYHGDARNLNLINDESIDLIATHPPYANIIPYSKNKRIEGDLSQASSLETYLTAIREVAAESFRVLKPGRYCAILIGDTRRRRHYVPVALRVMQQFLDAGFILKEDIIKIQWHTKVTGKKWMGLSKTADECWVEKPEEKHYWTDFYLIEHEHLFIFRKPEKGESVEDYKDSMRWWGNAQT